MTSAMDHAYVALLHGSKSEFFLYALVLGCRLHYFDTDCNRLLLVSKTSFSSAADRACLQRFWKVKEVDLVDIPMLDKSQTKRHRHVFTKLYAFQVPFRKVVFLDLDVIVLRSLSDLFFVEAPAGMYHGRWNRMLARHGFELPSEEAFSQENGCINAGLLRIDPQPTELGRRSQVRNMLSAARRLESCSFLPEQYFLVQFLEKWHHIDVRWNCEVYPRYYVEDGGQVMSAESQLPMDWLLLSSNQDSLQEKVHMFHFSGTWLEPWWFIHLRAEDGHNFVRHELEHRDPPGLVALAVKEWLVGMEEMRQSLVFSDNEKENVEAHVSHLAQTASHWWMMANTACPECKKLLYFASELGLCEECKVQSDTASTSDQAKSEQRAQSLTHSASTVFAAETSVAMLLA
jgi:lipopolysaccharide biosynthesis glycosyltransferase